MRSVGILQSERMDACEERALWSLILLGCAPKKRAQRQRNEQINVYCKEWLRWRRQASSYSNIFKELFGTYERAAKTLSVRQPEGKWLNWEWHSERQGTHPSNCPTLPGPGSNPQQHQKQPVLLPKSGMLLKRAWKDTAFKLPLEGEGEIRGAGVPYEGVNVRVGEERPVVRSVTGIHCTALLLERLPTHAPVIVHPSEELWRVSLIPSWLEVYY